MIRLLASSKRLRQGCHSWAAQRHRGACRQVSMAATAASKEEQKPHMERAILDQEDWQSLQDHMVQYDTQREIVIKRSRDAQKLAKQAIYSLHRGDFTKAGQQLQAVEHVALELQPIVDEEPTLRLGSYGSAMEEYAEGMVFRAYLQEGRVLKAKELARLVQPEEYLSGVLDFTGELNRHAVARATLRDTAAVVCARDVVDALQGQFLQMDLRNGSLRKKFDTLKYTLRKLETMLYELSLTEASGLRSLAKDGKEEEQAVGDSLDEQAAATEH